MATGLPLAVGCALMHFLGDQPMRVLAILALALLLTGCEGDRIKNGNMNERQAQPQSTVLIVAHDARPGIGG